MKRNVVKGVLLLVLSLFLSITNVYAEGANVTSDKKDVKPGEIVEIYVALNTQSIGYDIRITPSNSNLIESMELVDRIGEGNTSRVYLVQLASASDRTVYPSGTRIATLRYKISNNAKAGDKITINVSGDIAGKDSSEKNTMNENITLNIIEESKVEQNQQVVTPVENKEQTQNVIHNSENSVPVVNNSTTQNNSITQNTSTTIPNNNQITTNTTTKKETKKNTANLPKTGIETEMPMIIGITMLAIVQISMVIRYIKNK